MPLPFLSFPDLIQTKILQNQKPIDLFVFSLASTKTKEISFKANLRIDSLEWTFDEIDTSMKLKTSFESWYLGILSENPGPRQPFGALVFNEAHFLIHRIRNYLQISPENLTQSQRIQLFEHLTKCVFDVFRISECHLKARILKGTEFVSKFTDRLERFTVLDTVPAEDLKNFLEKFVIYSLEIERNEANLPRLNGFQFILKTTWLVAYDLQWLTPESLWNSECKNFFIRMVPEDMWIDIIRRWKDSEGFSNLKSFCSRGLRDDQLDFILEGLEMTREEVEADEQLRLVAPLGFRYVRQRDSRRGHFHE